MSHEDAKTVSADLLQELDLGLTCMAEIWQSMLVTLGVTGMTRSICHQLQPVDMGDGNITFAVSTSLQPLLLPPVKERITSAIQAQLPVITSVRFVPAVTGASPATLH